MQHVQATFFLQKLILCVYTQCIAHMLKGYSNNVSAVNLAA